MSEAEALPRRKLTTDELRKARDLVDTVREMLETVSGSDEHLLFAYRRYTYIRLTYDERGNPTERSKLKAYKSGEQQGKCFICGEMLPDKYTILDRLVANKGYTKENTRLIHQECDIKQQREKGYA